MATVKYDQNFYSKRYVNRSSLMDFLGYNDKSADPWAAEVMAIRIHQVLNRCQTLDWCYASEIVWTVRDLAPGFRAAGFLTYIMLPIFALAVTPDRVFWMDYNLGQPDNDSLFVADGVLYFVWALWTFVLAIESWAYWLSRFGGQQALQAEDGTFTFFYRVATVHLKEDRDKLRAAVGGRTPWEWSLAVYFAIIYIANFVLGSWAIHTLLSHMFHDKNVHFMWVLIVLCIGALLSALDDIFAVGSPWGVQEASPLACALLSIRAIFLVPLTVWWTIAAMFVCFPPSQCVTC